MSINNKCQLWRYQVLLETRLLQLLKLRLQRLNAPVVAFPYCPVKHVVAVSGFGA